MTAYVRALGFSLDPLPCKTFQCTPMRYRGAHVGSFFLAEKEGGEEFTDEDEEVLGLLASNAATAIANARTHRAEQRARADLEALVETTPVGVVVFEARTGNLVSLNREAKRIVEGLRMPGRTAEQLLEVVTCQRADGRTVSLGEFPLAQELSRGETVRAEEIVLSVPDGRSVTTLVNATPIHPRTARWSRWSSPCRTWRRSRSWSGCGRSSWAWSAMSCGRRWPRSRARLPPCSTPPRPWIRPRCASSSASSARRPITCAA